MKNTVVVTEVTLQSIFRSFLDRSCDEPNDVATILAQGRSEYELAVQVMESDEYCSRTRYCIDAAGDRYFFTPPIPKVTDQHPLSLYPDGSAFHLLHAYFRKSPDLPFQIDTGETKAIQLELETCSRIITAFRRAQNDQERGSYRDGNLRGVWKIATASHHQEVLNLLRAGDEVGLATYLAAGLRRGISYGLQSLGHVQSEQAVTEIDRSESTRLEHKLLLKDRVVRLAEALGLVSVENPEQGRYGENIHLEFTDLVRKIEAEIGTAMGRPPIMGIFGVRLGELVLDIKAPEDAYLAYRARTLRAKSVVEIGGGFGGAALQMVRTGIACSIYDLPVVNALQAYFLIGALGHEAVRLFDESNENAIVKVYPWQAFFQPLTADLVVNRDSMAEFPIEIAQAYLQEITNKGLRYLSINQEVENESGESNINQIAVKDVAKNIGMIREARSPYWLRKGYVEEIFI